MTHRSKDKNSMKLVADSYDDLVNWPARLKREAPFFRSIFKQHNIRSVLDAGCGTGQHVLLFSEWELEAMGADIDRDMIRVARRNAREVNCKAKFVVAPFQQLAKKLRGQKFDALTCLGNSLSQLDSIADLRRSLRQMRDILNPGGVLILHTINWQKIIKEGKREVPLRHIVSRRPARKKNQSGKVSSDETILVKIFNVTSSRKVLTNMVTLSRSSGTWSQRIERGSLISFMPNELRDIASSLKLQKIKFYADHRSRPFRPATSDTLLVVCQTPRNH